MRPEIPQHVDVELMEAEVDALAVDVVDAADAVGLEDLLHLHDGRVVDEGVADHKGLPGMLGGADDRLGIRDGPGERLLDEHVLAGSESFLGDLAMRAHRGRDTDRVDLLVVQKLVMVRGHTHGRKALAEALEALLGKVSDRDRLGTGRLAQVPHEVRSPVPRPDHTHPERHANTRSS